MVNSSSKTFMMRVKSDSDVYEWLQKQKNSSNSVRRAIEIIVKTYGMKDLDDALIEQAAGQLLNKSQKKESSKPEQPTEEKAVIKESPKSRIDKQCLAMLTRI